MTSSKSIFSALKKKSKSFKLREKLKPGTIVILLLGVHAGKRVVMLKSLGSSGNILVAGPHCINHVSLRRVNHRHVIATSTCIDTGGIDLNKFDDSYFKKPKQRREKTSTVDDSVFVEQGSSNEHVELSPEKQEDYNKVEAQLMKIISNQPLLDEYLKKRFYLRDGEYPHNLVF